MLIDICMKFPEDSFRGFQVTERTQFVTDRRTDRRTDGQTPGEKQYVSQPFGGRHNEKIMLVAKIQIPRTNTLSLEMFVRT